jgi:tetratricopeptide (TPR) repeat protein
VLARDSRHPTAQLELGRIAYKAGNKRAAVDCLRTAIAIQPDNAEFHNELGYVLIGLGERQQAHHAFTRALAIDPLHLGARINIEIALKRGVPLWHFPMMNDVPRNVVYDEAIRRVAAGRSVLDIGTGAGLLAMMTARAGAKWVVSCEGIPLIAAKAKAVVAANDLDNRIKLIAKPSRDLRIGTDLPERAEVLEVFGTTALNEHVIPTIAYAHAQLLQPGASVVPNAASARAYLAGGAALEGYFFVDRAVGFTLNSFNLDPRAGDIRIGQSN